MSKPRAIQQLLTDQAADGLDGLIRRGQQLQRLGALVSDVLGAEFAPHCQVANLRKHTLILSVRSAAWGSRLRYHVPRLLQQFRNDERLRNINEVAIRVQPAGVPLPPATPRRATMSRDAALCVRRCAESVSDQRLSAALEQLARRRSKVSP